MSKIKQFWRWLMSLYIGPSGATKVLHVYDGTTNAEPDVVAGTSFHSTLPYYYNNSVHRFTPSSAVLTEINTGYVTSKIMHLSTSTPIPTSQSFIVFVGYKNGVRYFFPTSFAEGTYGSQNDKVFVGNPQGFCPAVSVLSTTTIMVGSFFENGRNPIFTILDWDYVDAYVFSNTISSTISYDISISNTDIKINDRSIFIDKYAHFMTTISDRLNDYDEIIAIPFGGYSVGYSYFRNNYVSSTDNLSYTDATTGGHQLIQLINSYPYAISSVSLDGSNSSISVTKNNISLIQFLGSQVFKMLTGIISTYQVAYQNEGCPAGLSIRRSQLVSLQPGNTLYVIFTISCTYFSNPLIFPRSNVLVAAGNRIVFIDAHYLGMYGEISSDCNYIHWTVYNLYGSQLNWNCNINADIHILS